MISTENHSLKKTIFFAIKTIAIVLVACFAIEYPIQMIGRVSAADKVYYISEVKMFQAESEAEAKRLCESEGYVCAQKNLNAGTGKEAVFMGYKVTEDKKKALYDIKLLQMNDGYQIKDYKEANEQLEKSNSGAAKALLNSADEFISNYEDESPKAQAAYEGLNLFSVPEANMKLGDFIVQGKADENFFAKVITHSGTGAVNAITNLLSAGLTPNEKETNEKTGEETDVTWADAVKDSTLWRVIDSEDTSKDQLMNFDRDLGDYARELHKQLQTFATNFENAEANYSEDAIIAEAKNTSVEEVVENTEKPSDTDNSVTYINAYDTLNQYFAYEGKRLGDFLVEMGKETTESVEIRRLYPVVDAMSIAQRQMIGMAGVLPLISTLGKNEKNAQAEALIQKTKAKIKELMGTDAFDIWTNANPEMADKKVAFTDDGIRKSAAEQSIDALAKNDLENAKQTINTVFQWINIGSCAITVLTFFAGKVGLAGIVGVIAAKATTSVVASTVSAVATKVMAISATVSSWSFIFSLVIIGLTILFYVGMLIAEAIIKNKPKEYTTMADFAVDVKTTPKGNVNVIYKAVMDNKNRIADLNAYEAQNGWVCMYTSTDPNTGSPIRADENGNMFNIVYGSANTPNGCACVSYFGQVTPGNCNTGAKKDEVNGIYINYYTDLSLANRSGGSSAAGADTTAKEGTKQYYSTIIVTTGKTVDIAKNKILKKGYHVYDQNLSPSSQNPHFHEEQYTYIGYQTTTDPKQAIRDIRVGTYTGEAKQLFFGDISYACSGTLGYPANTRDEDKKMPGDLDALFYTRDPNAGTPIEVGKLHLLDDPNKAEAGWEAVTTFSGMPYNFASSRYVHETDNETRLSACYYTGYMTRDGKWDSSKTYLYYEPEEKYTEGTKYLSGIFFGFGADAGSSDQKKISALFDRLASVSNVEEPNGSRGVNLAQSYYYIGSYLHSDQKYLRLFYSWSYNPYRALTDVQVFKGIPYTSKLPYSVSKAVAYEGGATSAASLTANYVAATVAVQRSFGNKFSAIRGILPENAYMAPNGLLHEGILVQRGFTRETQTHFKLTGPITLLPTNLYVSGHVKERPRLTLDDVVVTQNRHDGVNNNSKLTCDVSGETTLGGNKAEGDFFSIQNLQNPHSLTAYNISYPAWSNNYADLDDTDEENGSNFHAAGTPVYMYIKHKVLKKKYISQIFVGAASREDSEDKDKEVLRAYDSQVDWTALSAATAAGSDEVIPFNIAGDPKKAWHNYVKGREYAVPPEDNPAAYVSVARTDNPSKAVKSVLLFKSDKSTTADQIQVDGAVYYCASNTTPIKMVNGSKYFLYYSYNQGTVPGKPITELEIGTDVFLSGYSTALVVDRADILYKDEKSNKMKIKERSKPYGETTMETFIHAKYDVKSTYFNKIFAASGDTEKEAQLGLLEQGCTEFCNINLNKGAGGKYVYFGYRGFSLNEELINKKPTAESKEAEKERQLQEAVYDIICTVGEEFHPEGIMTDRYQLYYTPVAKRNTGGTYTPTNLNEGTSGPKIYMYYTTTFAAKNYNETYQTDVSHMLSTMPKDYLKSPLTKIGFAQYDYVPYSKPLDASSSDSTGVLPWEYVMLSNNKVQVDLNEGAVDFGSDHMMSDNRISMFVQREDGSVKPSAEITGGYNSTLVAESKLYLNL